LLCSSYRPPTAYHGLSCVGSSGFIV
jgi:hypothetical protein